MKSHLLARQTLHIEAMKDAEVDDVEISWNN
jgi:hypothetical protein